MQNLLQGSSLNTDLITYDTYTISCARNLFKNNLKPCLYESSLVYFEFNGPVNIHDY